MKIALNRKRAYADSARSYKVVINGQQVGKINQNRDQSFEVNKGHDMVEVYLKIDWCRSNKILVPYKEGDTVRLTCQSNLAGWKVILSLFYIIFLPQQYIRLWEFENNDILDQ